LLVLNIHITPKGGIETKMKILRSKKALSPVVASIILIAVTVAVSIAVAAWMGALTFTFMGTEELKITNVEFVASTPKTVNVTLQNTGTTPITVNEIWVGSTKSWSTGDTVAANSQEEIAVTYTWSNGNNYQIKVVTAKGNQFYYNAVAPST
jgi:flagellin-like protein